MNDVPSADTGGDDTEQTVLRPAARPPAVVQDNALPAGTRLEEFEIQGLLGIGGFGIVYLALDLSLGRQIALKEFMPSALASRTQAATVVVKAEQYRPTYELALNSFVNEARLLARFDHPALVKVHRFWQANGTAYMAMPYYKGQTLRDHVRHRSEPVDEVWLSDLLRPLLDALEVLHGQQCYHRDIAPDNILLLAGSGRPLLLDFGAARRVISDMTQALTVILKPGYAPIEQYAEIPGLKQGPWTDLYALASVIHFVITGAAPAPSVARIVQDQVQPLAVAAAGQFSPRFLQAVDHALSVRPEQRPQSVAEFRAELGLLPVQASAPAPAAAEVTAAPAPRAPESPTAIAPPPAAVTQAGSAKSGRTGLLMGGAAALALLGGAAFWLRGPSPDPAPPSPVSAAPAASVQTATPPQESSSASAPTPAAAPAPAPAPTSSGPAVAVPTVSADAFEQVLATRSQDFDVQVRASRSSLRIGRDRLEFTVESRQDGHVYVIAQDPDGARVLLFPNSQSSQNRVRAGQPLKLPQASWPLVAVPPAGRERLLVIVARSARDYAAVLGPREHWFRKLPAAGQATAAAQPPGWLAGMTDCQTPGCGDYGAAVLELGITR